MKGSLRDIHDPGDGGLRDTFVQERPDFLFLAVEFRSALRAFGPSEPFAPRFRCRQALFGAFCNQIAFNLCKEPKESDHGFGMEVLFALETHCL
ncbi:MAG TPA: hypothetical protein VFU31_31185, partial [Candidatus Binatia bacterium]|nr:hypothetical protein [Candidatus Binatia bacterium]